MVTFVDRRRPTPAVASRNLPARPSRTLPVMLLYPAKGKASPGAAPVDGAPAAPGQFPVVEFSHGNTSSGPAYTGVLQQWARAGYIIAAPTFPLTSGSQGSAGFSDYQHQPGDVSFVITSLLEQAAKPGDALHGHVATGCVAAAGHSLGAITTLGVTFNSCCADKRIRAAISLSGLLLPFPGGSYDRPPPVPLLLIHGAADRTVPIAGSEKVFADFRDLRYFLTEPGASHIGILSGADGRLTNEAVVLFLDGILKGDSAQALRLLGHLPHMQHSGPGH